MSWLEKRRADRERDEKVLKLIESMSDTVVIFKDGEGHWLRANKKAIELFRLEGVKYFGKTDKELAEYSIAPETMLDCIETDNKTWLQGKATRIEERVIGKDIDNYFDVLKEPIFKESGTRYGLIVMSRDITIFKRTEEALMKEFMQQVNKNNVVNLHNFKKKVF